MWCLFTLMHTFWSRSYGRTILINYIPVFYIRWSLWSVNISITQFICYCYLTLIFVIKRNSVSRIPFMYVYQNNLQYHWTIIAATMCRLCHLKHRNMSSISHTKCTQYFINKRSCLWSMWRYWNSYNDHRQPMAK